ncbi:hypothetical protein ABZ135_35770 [Streptomyces sp. NPDC006339]|uniref:hypothetical protein n=1 Tax=Streptomyces sp. NPDC006339 TaxID=3156755 RepID=UPI0033B13462
MFEVLPGVGLVLPRGAGVLRFGMPERAAQWAVATLADVRETWVCRTGWAFSACYEGLDLLVCGDTADRWGRADHRIRELALVRIERSVGAAGAREPSAVPVVLRDVDVFGYPAREVLDVLTSAPHPTVSLPSPPSPAGYLTEIRLSAG